MELWSYAPSVKLDKILKRMRPQRSLYFQNPVKFKSSWSWKFKKVFENTHELSVNPSECAESMIMNLSAESKWIYEFDYEWVWMWV